MFSGNNPSPQKSKKNYGTIAATSNSSEYINPASWLNTNIKNELFEL